MPMRMVVLCSERHRSIVIMLVVHVMCVFMLMIKGFMFVFMSVLLGKVQPNTQSHERADDQQTFADRFSQERDCHQGSKERGYREVGCCSGCAEMA